MPFDAEPDGWEVTTLKAAAGELFIDGDWVESKDQDPGGEVRLIQLADIGDGTFLNKSARFLTAEKGRQLRCTILREGDLLISRMADPIARCCIFPGVDQPAATVVDVTIVRPGPAVDRDYLSYAVSAPAFRSAALGAASGTTRSRISRLNLGAIRLTLPPLDEQRRIAEVLRSMDAVSRVNETECLAAEQLLTAYLNESFGDAPDEAAGCPLEELLTRIIDYRGVPPPKSDGGVPLITAKNVRLGYLDQEPREFIAEQDYGGWMRRGVPSPGDILFTTEAPLGFVAEFPSYKAALGQRTITLVADPERAERKYLKWLLLSPPVQELIHRHATGSTARGIKQSTFRKLRVQVPSLEKQRRIAGCCEDVWSVLEMARASGERLSATKSKLADDLLTGRVRVPA